MINNTEPDIVLVRCDDKTLVSFPLARVNMPILKVGDMVEIQRCGRRATGELFKQNSEHILLWFPNEAAARLAIAALYPADMPTDKDMYDALSNAEVAPTLEES